ncbi:MAG: uracil-DNA glycosylase [Anaerolineae bacterium]
MDTLIDALVTLPETDRLHNIYSDSAVRRDTMARYLQDMAARQPRHLMVLEAPGYRGCALTGIPITSERIMMAGVVTWGLFGEGYTQASDHPRGMAEASATILWNALIDHADDPPLLWNTVPLHPHKAGNRQSNRTPTRAEQRAGAVFIPQILDLFPSVEAVMGVGRIAQGMLAELDLHHAALRHPAQGGKADFIAGLQQALRPD